MTTFKLKDAVWVKGKWASLKNAVEELEANVDFRELADTTNTIRIKDATVRFDKHEAMMEHGSHDSFDEAAHVLKLKQLCRSFGGEPLD